ncbi:beta-glucosidase [Rudaea sp.]|uniref:beta-glucosidase n=1 Tax=Rudaea sp. TaxID=2136325 RepID=UPI002ED62919
MYKDASAPTEARVADLLARMTPEEKFWQLFMVPGEVTSANRAQFRHGIFGLQIGAEAQGGAAQQMLSYDTHENAESLARRINAMQHYFVDETRLGIPMLPFDEALHGLVRDDATAFPQAIGLAASFDAKLLATVGKAIAVEAKARGLRDLLGPVVNIADDVRWGRVEETYGEDPYLTTVLGSAFMQAIENENLIATPKHFIANVGDGGRDSYPIEKSAHWLDEVHFPPFKAAVDEAHARSLMTAYNSVDGTPASANAWLLTQTLKDDWKFRGFVISDAGAVGGANVLHHTARDYAQATAMAIGAGLDVIFQTQVEQAELFMPPFLDGSIAASRIDDAVARVLRAKFELGLFDHPYVDEAAARRPLQNGAHHELARQAALQSFVLLKNRNSALPFANPKTLLVLGEDATEARLGGYSGKGIGTTSILDGLKQRAGKATKVLYAQGSARNTDDCATIDATHLRHDGAPGLQAAVFDSSELSGTPVAQRVDSNVDFHWMLAPPDAKAVADNYSVRWRGELLAPAAGHYRVGLEGNDGFRLYLDGKLVIDRWTKASFHRDLVDVDFTSADRHFIVVEFREMRGGGRIRLLWNADARDDGKARRAQARELARDANAIIVVAGIHEGEFRDRASLDLPGDQEALIHAMHATGKPVIVVLVGGSAVTMQHWENEADAILAVWYPGEAGGDAVAQTLFGDSNPSGRLPITWPLDAAQLPLVYNHKPSGRGDDYDNLSGEAQFPFGYGLSYTTFAYSNPVLDKTQIKPGESATLRVTVRNTGARDGDEVVQLYMRPLQLPLAQPVLALRAFQRIHLKRGERRTLAFLVDPRVLQTLDRDRHWTVEAGAYRLMVGASSRELPLKRTLVVAR